MAFLKWSIATSTMNMLKSGALNKDKLKTSFLTGTQNELSKEVEKRRKHNKPVTFDILYKQVFKDKEYTKLYNELGITDQLNRIIKQSLDKA
jgi:hypothetical protein